MRCARDVRRSNRDQARARTGREGGGEGAAAGSTARLRPAPGTGLASPETGSQNRRYRDLSERQRPHAPHLNPQKCPQIGGCSSETGKRRFAREDSNLQPDRYERSALTIELRARSARAQAAPRALHAGVAAKIDGVPYRPVDGALIRKLVLLCRLTGVAQKDLQ